MRSINGKTLKENDSNITNYSFYNLNSSVLITYHIMSTAHDNYSIYTECFFLFSFFFDLFVFLVCFTNKLL